MFMPAMMASNLPAVRAGIIPSQSCCTTVHWTLMRLHSSAASSTSKPASLPSGWTKFQGS